jgi:hypothetical protein
MEKCARREYPAPTPLFAITHIQDFGRYSIDKGSPPAHNSDIGVPSMPANRGFISMSNLDGGVPRRCPLSFLLKRAQRVPKGSFPAEDGAVGPLTPMRSDGETSRQTKPSFHSRMVKPNHAAISRRLFGSFLARDTVAKDDRTVFGDEDDGLPLLDFEDWSTERHDWQSGNLKDYL